VTLTSESFMSPLDGSGSNFGGIDITCKLDCASSVELSSSRKCERGLPFLTVTLELIVGGLPSPGEEREAYVIQRNTNTYTIIIWWGWLG
jgi:hypothetical protein